MGLNQVKQASPRLVPLVEREIKLSLVDERFRRRLDLASHLIDRQEILRRGRHGLLFKETTFVCKVRERYMYYPSIYKFFTNMIRD
jgi:hypothetical protein